MTLVWEVQRYEDDDTGDTGEREAPDDPEKGIDRLAELRCILTRSIEICSYDEEDAESEEYPSPSEMLCYESSPSLDDLSCECQEEDESHDPDDEEARISKESPCVDRCSIESDDQKK